MVVAGLVSPSKCAMPIRTVSLTRRTLFGALGARAISRAPAAHAQELAPVPGEDWTLVEPGEVGLSADQLTAAGEYAAVNMPDITGIVVVRNNGLAYERYFGDAYGVDDPIDVRSITKCVTGTLAGMAIDDGVLALSSTIGETIPELIPINADPRTASITIENLLTMSSGWAWDTHADWGTLTAAPNWTELTLGLPVVYEPGAVFAYNTGGSHLLGVITQQVVGMDLDDLAERRLWAPLGVREARVAARAGGDRFGRIGGAADATRCGEVWLAVVAQRAMGRSFVDLRIVVSGSNALPFAGRFHGVCRIWLALVGGGLPERVSRVFRVGVWQQLCLCRARARSRGRCVEGIRDATDIDLDRAAVHRGMDSTSGDRIGRFWLTACHFRPPKAGGGIPPTYPDTQSREWVIGEIRRSENRCDPCGSLPC
jgi:hypothetical protein